MKKSILMSCAALVFVSFTTTAQKLALEKTYEITGKSKRGYLDEVAYDPSSKMTKLSFVTRVAGNFTGSKTKVKYQEYYFDKEFNFVKMDENEDVYRNKKYKGDNYTVEGISVENNMTGTLVLRKKLITYTWDWFFGGYKKKIKLLDKVKPKDDSGNKYMLLKKFENDENGDVIVMVIARGKGANMNEYVLLKIDNQLNVEVTDKFEFSMPQMLASSYLITNISNAEDDDSGLDEEEAPAAEGGDDSDEQGDLSTSDVGLIWASTSGGKKAKADPHDYTFLQINNLGKVVRRVAIKTGASVWAINQMITAGESVYLMGPANDGKYLDQVPIGDAEGMKWKLFQLCKITGDKVEYVTTTDLEEFESKLQTPPSQKKTPSYRGKRFHFTTADISSDGSIVICGQNYEKKKNGPKSWRDVIMFYFDGAGKLKAQYGVRREENNKYAQAISTPQRITKGEKTIYWTVMEMDGIREEREGKVKAVKALIYPNVARIDPVTGKISDFVQFGTVDGKPKYYLHNGNPILPMSEENAIVYMGVDKPGKTLWFGKVILE
jgi:hypothetical protein